MTMIVETDRLMLRLFEEDDVEDTKSFWCNEEVMQHCGGAIPEDFLAKVFASYASCYEKMGLSVFAIVEKESRKVIGAAGFNVRESLDEVELIYHFAKASWGKGYATEAASACVNVAKATGKVKSIFASADPLNENSLKILEKIGFTFEGTKWADDTNQEEPFYKMNVI